MAELLAEMPSDAQAPAPFWLRAGAYMIDSLVVGMIGGALAVLTGVPALRTALGAVYVTCVPVIWSGETLGKHAAGLAIRRMDGEALTYGGMFLRWIGYFLSVLLAGAGVVMAGVRKDKRALHDFLADTRVVRVREISRLRYGVIAGVAGLGLPLVAFVGILAAIAIPNFVRFQQKAQQAAVKSQLAALRTALQLYRAENAGLPADLAALAPKYIEKVPAVTLPGKPADDHVELYHADVCAGADVDGAKLRGAGGWGYVSDAGAPCQGRLFVDSADAVDGQPWFRY